MIGGEYILKRLHFDTFEDFAYSISDKLDLLTDEFSTVSVIAKYEEAKEVIKELLRMSYNMASIELHDIMYEHYYDEYIISISNTDTVTNVWCEKLKNENGYLYDESDITYIMDNCSQKVIKYCNAAFVYEVGVSESDCNDDDMINNEEDIHGFTLSNTDDNGYQSFSYYTTNSLAEKDIQEMIEKLGFSFSK